MRQDLAEEKIKYLLFLYEIQDSPLSVTAAARACGVAKSTFSRTLSAFWEMGYVEESGYTGGAYLDITPLDRLKLTVGAEVLFDRELRLYDKGGDEHYDLMSAFQKSMRGSDPDATVHYLGRLLEAGDLPSACRRLLVCACEDVGLAWPQIIPIVKAAVDAALMVGLPEARIPLADAAILVALAPKSNSAYCALDSAIADIKAGKAGPIPRNLQNKHYDSAEVERKGQFYQYPHDAPHHWLPQQYLPDSLLGARYYQYGENKNEQSFRAYWEKIKHRGGGSPI